MIRRYEDDGFDGLFNAVHSLNSYKDKTPEVGKILIIRYNRTPLVSFVYDGYTTISETMRRYSKEYDMPLEELTFSIVPLLTYHNLYPENFGETHD